VKDHESRRCATAQLQLPKSDGWGRAQPRFFDLTPSSRCDNIVENSIIWATGWLDVGLGGARRSSRCWRRIVRDLTAKKHCTFTHTSLPLD